MWESFAAKITRRLSSSKISGVTKVGKERFLKMRPCAEALMNAEGTYSKFKDAGGCFYENGKAYVGELRDGKVVLVHHPELDAQPLRRRDRRE